MRNLNLLILLLLPTFLLAQKKDYKLGEIDRSYFEMTHCPWDSSAASFYILDYGVTRFDANFDVEFKTLVRLKILKSSEFGKADISIPYDQSKGTPKVKGFTYNLENGQVVTSELGKDGIFKEKIIDNRFELKFTLPNVKEGSIIEYEYTLNMGSHYRLNTWYFQTSVPVEKSEYHVFIPDWLSYQRFMTPYVPLNVSEVLPENDRIGTYSVTTYHHHYEAWKVPAFKSEVYLASRNDVISKIDFELKGTQFPGRMTETILPNTYAELSKKIFERDYWSKDLAKAPWAKDVFETVFGDSTISNLDKATRLFDYVKSFQKSDDSSLSLKKCLDAKKGTDSELNRLLIAMLNEIGLQAEPVRISTRGNGKLHPVFPLESKFNHSIVKLTIDEDVFLLDASEKYSVFGVLPRYCINERGLVINGKEEWVELNPYENNGKTITGEFEISEYGVLSGTLQVRRKGYDAWEFDLSLEKSGEEEYKEELVKDKDNWIISYHEIDKGDEPSTTDEKFEIEIEGKVEDLGNLMYVSPIVYAQSVSNPFKIEERKYPVNLGAPQSDIYFVTIKIPEGYVVESLPETISLSLPNNSGSIVYSVVSSNDKVVITQRYRMNKVEYLADEYPYLREFHATIVAKQAEQIVLKKL